MIRRNKKSRKYHAPSAKVTHMVLESNFCKTYPLRINADVDMLENVNADASYKEDAGEAFYFDQF